MCEFVMPMNIVAFIAGVIAGMLVEVMIYIITKWMDEK